MNTRRMQYIDMAKGIGILLVIIGHTMSLEKSDQKIGETFAAPNRCAVSIYVLVGRCNSRYYLEWTNKRAY